MNAERKAVSQHIPSFELLIRLLRYHCCYCILLKPKLVDHDTNTQTVPLAIRTIYKIPLGRGKLGGVGPKHYR